MKSVQHCGRKSKWSRCQFLCFWSLVVTVVILLMTAAYWRQDQILQFPFLTFPVSFLDSNQSTPFIPTGYSNHRRGPVLIDHKDDPSLILIWTRFFGNEWAPRMFDDCPADLNCNITFDRRRVNDSSAIMFHIQDLNLIDIPADRSPDQYYIFALWESPPHTAINLRSPKMRYFFNLTMTYRLDSDGYSPYGMFRESNSKKADLENITNIVKAKWKSKSKLVAWFVSNCNTPGRRELFVEELRKYLPVDVYGACGSFKCPRTDKTEDPCTEMLTKKYKFYLSLENSLCKDYVTEKLYHRMNQSIIIPLVMERKLIMNTILDDATARVINKSIIAVDDFPTVQALADYLVYLDKKTTAYMEYLQWRRTHEVIVGLGMPQCQLCRVIKEGKRRQLDIANWWIDQGPCHTWGYNGTQ